MNIRAVVFDLYGTLVNIRTDEGDPELYRQVSRFLSYNRVYVEPELLRDFYMEKIKSQLSKSREVYPDVDVLKIFTLIVHEFGVGRMELKLPLHTARLFRALSRKTFEPFPGVYHLLEHLSDHYPLALLSDAQRCYTEPEVEALKLGWFFQHTFFSSDYGFRKPDPKYFGLALKALGVKPQEAVYVGDNHFRDMVGAKRSGMKMVLVRSSERECEGFTPDVYLDSISDLESALERIKAVV